MRYNRHVDKGKEKEFSYRNKTAEQKDLDEQEAFFERDFTVSFMKKGLKFFS